jgi:hypothetical protein
MSKNKLSIHVTVSSSGTYNVDVSPNTFPSATPPIPRLSYVFSGAATAPYTIVPTGSPSKDTFVEIVWNANLSIGASALQIFGVSVPDELIASKFIAECLYDGAAWIVTIRPSFDELGIIGSHRLASDSVTTTSIADDSVTLAKMYELATGSVIFGNASNRPTALSVADSTIVVGDSSTGLVSVAVSGDATIAKTGALTIANDAITTAKIADDAVTSAKLDDDSNKTQVVIPTSFETAGEIGVLEYKICFPCTIEAIHGTVTKPFTSTGTHIFKDDTGTVLTGSQIDMSNALTLGNIVSTTPTANNTFVAGDVIKIETSVSGAVGGRSTIVLCMLKS